ncbi:hypothetical protein SteCoe_8288 [Stentor coeruleus]|uniref:GOLD domain-containing protein n=1 Tax=Stentor coeruleus TaxID=5963 RepID=A0A1R2CKV7_9CILI|nr:hypothetical protein SteCoe_8288 [Stentor coeruleus]
MKSSLLLILSLFAILASGLNVAPLAIGSSCSLFPDISNVQLQVNPWPIIPASPTSCILTGSLDKNETIGSVQVGQEYKSTWTNNLITVNAFYAKGQTFTFNYNMNSPTQSGSYTEKFTVLQSSTSNNILCWQFSFSI